MSYEDEFKTVDLLLESDLETRAVDAFALSVIKAERQIRKIFTYLVFQFPSFKFPDISNLIDTLAGNRNVYFDGFIKGFNEIYPKSLKQLYGAKYDDDLKSLKDAIKIRNKIFHGQLTGKNLSRENLTIQIGNIRNWCESLASALKEEIGFDGFMRNSFQKSKLKDNFGSLKLSLKTINEYKDFIQRKMVR